DSGMLGGKDWGVSNYAINGLVFANGTCRLPDSVPDGMSQTVFFTEKFAVCSAGFQVGGSLWSFPPGYPNSFLNNFFALYPVTAPPVANPLYGLWDQQPPPGTCNPRNAQSAHTGGINVCMGDCSVRGVATSVSQQSWTAVLTPNSAPIYGMTDLTDSTWIE